MKPCISAVQHLRPLRGGAQSHLLRATDENWYVTKFQNNPQHIRVLANEMLATRLGLTLGLPMPQVVVIEVSDWLIEHTADLRIQLGGRYYFRRASPMSTWIWASTSGCTFSLIWEAVRTSSRRLPTRMLQRLLQRPGMRW